MDGKKMQKQLGGKPTENVYVLNGVLLVLLFPINSIAVQR